MKALYTACLFCWAAIALSAQQLPLFGQYRENHALINPASLSPNYWALGSAHLRSSAGITYRRQWTGLSDGPLTLTAHFETISPKKLRSAFGMNLISDKTGPTGQNGGQLRYAYLIMDDDNGRWLSAGFSAGYYQAYYRGDQAILRDPGDVLGTKNVVTGQVDASGGVFYAGQMGDEDKVFYCGFSIMQIASVNFSEGLKRTPHFYGNIGLYKKMADGDGYEYFVEPSAWVRYVPHVPIQVDLTCRFHTPHYFWVGIGQSFSVSTADGGKPVKGNNLLFEAGLTLGEEQGLGASALRLGFGYHRSFTRFGADLGSSYEFNTTYIWQ